MGLRPALMAHHDPGGLGTQLDLPEICNEAPWFIEFAGAYVGFAGGAKMKAGGIPRAPPLNGGEKIMGSLEDEIRRAREQANILAEEARVLMEHTDERAEAANERARKARERLEELLRREQEGGEK
jgi:hypothetical protein